LTIIDTDIIYLSMKTKKLTAKQILKNKAANDKWWLEYDKKQLAGIDGDKLLSEYNEIYRNDLLDEIAWRDIVKNCPYNKDIEKGKE
jgi:hypothetical protein